MGSVELPIGTRCGRLVVLREVARKNGVRRMLVACDCGNETEVPRRYLTSPNRKTLSCGCWSKEQTGKRAWRHGLSNTTYQAIWSSMMARCYNPRNISYPLYGGRGIAVCERWHSLVSFASDMGERPSSSHSLDRIDNSGNYEPSNCRWATKREQAQNTRRNVLVAWKGEMLPAVVVAQIVGIKPCTLRSRIKKGWSFHDAVTRPVQKWTTHKNGR